VTIGSRLSSHLGAYLFANHHAWPNYSFKPTPLRSFSFAPALRLRKAFATARRGLTQVLGHAMNLDELAKKIQDLSSDKALPGLANQLVAWKDTSASVDDLAVAIERYIGNIWIDSNQDHERVYALWSAFRKDSIESVRGMTMNERLYVFGLLDRFDALQGDTERQAMYAKVHASVA
jgi:hypothetical protein